MKVIHSILSSGKCIRCDHVCHLTDPEENFFEPHTQAHAAFTAHPNDMWSDGRDDWVLCGTPLALLVEVHES